MDGQGDEGPLPGPALDALIGVRVFGTPRSARRYSTDAGLALEILKTPSWNPRWVIRESGRFPGGWEVVEPLSEKVFLDNTSEEFRRIATGRSAAHAICRAALAAGHGKDP